MNFAIDESVCSNAEEALKGFNREAKDYLYLIESNLLKVHCFMVARIGILDQ